MSRKNFSLDRKWRNVFWLPGPVPCARRSVLRSCPMVLGYCSISAGSSSFSSDDADRFLKLASAAVACWRPRISLRLRLSAFPVCPRGHRDFTQAKCLRHLYPYRPQGCLPSNPRASPEPIDRHRKKITGDGRLIEAIEAAGASSKSLNGSPSGERVLSVSDGTTPQPDPALW